MDKLCLRSYIKTRWLLGLTATQIHNELTAAYEQGFGKTTLMKNLLTNVSHLRLISTGERKSLLRDELFKYNLPVLT
jgi:hypothetical protein